VEVPIAHAGHWAMLVLYAVPVLIVLGSIVTGARRAKRERLRSEAPAPRPEANGAGPGRPIESHLDRG
jgi:hypothetical protein